MLGPDQHSSFLAGERIVQAKRAFVTRRADLALAKLLLSGTYRPQSGDLLLARVERVTSRNRIELCDGRRAHLYAGDEVIVCYGHRYAPDQYEATIPCNLDRCELVAAGGLAATVERRHASMPRPSTLLPLGLLADERGRRLNLAQFALPDLAVGSHSSPRIVAIAGASMNSGKTTTVSCLVRGLVDAGLRVAALKVTGTGAGGDLWMMADAGASMVLDFTDAGYASTYKLDTRILVEACVRLVRHAAAARPDVIVIEVADGLLQVETAALLRSHEFKAMVDVVVFAAGEAMGSEAGVRWLRGEGLPVRFLSGLISASPLAAREAEAITGLPVMTMAQLSRGDIVSPLIFQSEVRSSAQSVSLQESENGLAKRTVR